MMAMRCSLVLVLAGVGALPSIVFAQDDQSCARVWGSLQSFFQPEDSFALYSHRENDLRPAARGWKHHPRHHGDARSTRFRG